MANDSPLSIPILEHRSQVDGHELTNLVTNTSQPTGGQGSDMWPHWSFEHLSLLLTVVIRENKCFTPVPAERPTDSNSCTCGQTHLFQEEV